MTGQEIYNFISTHNRRYVYCESFVRIAGSKEDGFDIKESDYNIILFGMYDEDDLNTEILQIENIEVEKEGWYQMNCLFCIDKDSDDYREWTTIYADVIEFDFCITDEQRKKDLVEIQTGDIDLFN